MSRTYQGAGIKPVREESYSIDENNPGRSDMKRIAYEAREEPLGSEQRSLAPGFDLPFLDQVHAPRRNTSWRSTKRRARLATPLQ
jgi:hypothetical protein